MTRDSILQKFRTGNIVKVNDYVVLHDEVLKQFNITYNTPYRVVGVDWDDNYETYCYYLLPNNTDTTKLISENVEPLYVVQNILMFNYKDTELNYISSVCKSQNRFYDSGRVISPGDISIYVSGLVFDGKYFDTIRVIYRQVLIFTKMDLGTKVLDLYTGKEDYSILLNEAVLEFDFESNKPLKIGYTSNLERTILVMIKGITHVFLDLKAVEQYPQLQYFKGSNMYWDGTIKPSILLFKWNRDQCRNGIKSRINNTNNLNSTLYQRYYDEGVITNSYNITEGLKYTFGVELETSDGYIPNFVIENLNFKTVYDGSVTGPECVTGILSGDSGFYQLNRITNFLSKSSKIDHKCGIHVHIGGATFNKEFTVAAYKLGLLLQDEIFSMLPKGRLVTRNKYYIDKGRVQGACAKLPIINSLDYNKDILTTDKGVIDSDIDDMYNDIYKWLSDGRSVNNFMNKLYPHNSTYPNARYVWLNFVPCNFSRKRLLLDTTDSKRNAHNMLQKEYTLEFRNHSASLNYTKIKNWILICMAFVNYVENNTYKILSSKNITLEEVIKFSYNKNTQYLIDYINNRKDLFRPLDKSLDECYMIEDNEYKKDPKENIKYNKKEITKCV